MARSPGFAFPLSLAPRGLPSRPMAYASPVIALALTLAFGALLFVLLGKDPMAALKVFLVDPVKDKRALGEVLLKTVPLVLCALGLSVCYRANVWNIGAEGQLILGGIFAAATVLWFDVPGHAVSGVAVLVLASLAGIAGGMLWAGITALLRDRFNANEILVSLMLTYIAQQLILYVVNGPLKDPQGMNFPQSKVFSSEFLLPNLMSGSRLHAGFVVMLVLVAVMTVFLFRSFAGYRLQVGGTAPSAARYAGFSARASLWMALLISGGFAGLAGAFEVVGPIGQLLPSISPGYGFTAIIVAFVGRLHPVGAVFGGIVMSLFYIGGEMAQSRLGLPSAIGWVFQGMLLFFLLACDSLIDHRLRWRAAAAR
ncbi:ABC transporter permease [Cupriavidus gilardii]|uniref:ABC transporter permease n=1 Tax=Cupriavidus gilardii TaxID=82541 RepID=UPI0018E6AD7E|nr:ABC transporter permease [Cupriavidus gilardii]MCT9125642.1 ABC transporter permease [Cupriavidus gilardii]QQE07541.1 ABC transporter permease [Cupriavidus sp. ISTL7]UXC35215.1 ABC transporter permease [Cupriavidus gilardii]